MVQVLAVSQSSLCQALSCITPSRRLRLICIACFSLQTTQWLEILQRLCLHDKLDVQHRGLVIVYNLIQADQELAKKLVESEMLEILTIIGKQADDPKRQLVLNVARECLVKCMDYGLIKPLSQP